MFGKDTILADLQLIKPISNNEDELQLQVRLCKMLGLAFALSVPGSLMGLASGLQSGSLSGFVSGSAANLGGIGFVIALVLALRVRIVIKQHHRRLGGALLAWLCIIASCIGALSGPPTIRMLVWRFFK
jgi:hypothetical protein